MQLYWQQGEQAVAQVVDVLVDPFGLPLTPVALGALKGGKFDPGNVLGRPHHPLESLENSTPKVGYCPFKS